VAKLQIGLCWDPTVREIPGCSGCKQLCLVFYRVLSRTMLGCPDFNYFCPRHACYSHTLVTLATHTPSSRLLLTHPRHSCYSHTLDAAVRGKKLGDHVTYCNLRGRTSWYVQTTLRTVDRCSPSPPVLSITTSALYGMVGKSLG
jgi:hypothetical protein